MRRIIKKAQSFIAALKEFTEKKEWSNDVCNHASYLIHLLEEESEIQYEIASSCTSYYSDKYYKSNRNSDNADFAIDELKEAYQACYDAYQNR